MSPRSTDANLCRFLLRPSDASRGGGRVHIPQLGRLPERNRRRKSTGSAGALPRRGGKGLPCTRSDESVCVCAPASFSYVFLVAKRRLAGLPGKRHRAVAPEPRLLGSHPYQSPRTSAQPMSPPIPSARPDLG